MDEQEKGIEVRRDRSEEKRGIHFLVISNLRHLGVSLYASAYGAADVCMLMNSETSKCLTFDICAYVCLCI